MTPNTKKCAACRKEIAAGKEIRITLRKFTDDERTFYACSKECAEILKSEE